MDKTYKQFLAHQAQFASERIQLREWEDQNDKEMKSINTMIKNEMIDMAEQIDDLKDTVEKQDIKMDILLELMMKQNQGVHPVENEYDMIPSRD